METMQDTVEGQLLLMTNRKSYMGFLSIGTKIGDLERTSLNVAIAIILRYFAEFGMFHGHFHTKVVD